ncbi:F-box/FBD/LRR-repeat protein At4g26340-like [Arachis hypogaea]|uniref:F-box/FBD/LRR-repeat protein At4g26340-like n=1 Tax=Arachis hypogaea TaxID=3818 RepID=UPI000DECBD5A|nr:F-box/FBD/LRR-repeat protein At4g26340-like [Arachis hypogaea]XP_029144663.1 F-box/FBD/LRR-repeat protein At4g26340-like [Arachis hypogaea]QHO33246.1 F-box/FBD/LRR-repeat protein [Arachis hypogaea]QHO33247.1 F-box/FBD/LRR-repeat protein [Arachis hypogaea]
MLCMKRFSIPNKSSSIGSFIPSFTFSVVSSKLTMPKGKQRKVEEEESTRKGTPKIDLISSLPDSLLCHILSFLPTRCAMATSVLARRWRHLWKDLLALDLDNSKHSPYYLPGGTHRFIAFVNAVFAQRKALRVEKLRLACDIPRGEKKTIKTWIRTVVGPHLQEMYLDLSFACNEFGDRHIKLPEEVLTSASLESLVLKGHVFLTVYDGFVDLPSLKNLELDLNYVDPDFVLLGCPVLENLKLTLHESFPLNASQPPEIYMPVSLKRLTLIQDDDIEEDINDIEDLVIDTPLLEYLSITLWARCLQVSISDYPNMVEAHIDIDQDQEQVGWVLELLKALRQTKLLDLKLSTMECLLGAPAFELPEFPRLLNLELQIPYFDSGFLIKLLHNCHILQVLTLHNQENVSTVEPEEPSCWTLPMKDPDCVISHLKMFEFKGYKDSADEHGFVAYLLERGPILKTMKIHADPTLGLTYKQRIHQELSMVPRSSKTCRLIVT